MSAGWKKNCSSRKALRQFAAQVGDVRGRRRVMLLQRNQDFAVHRADGRRIAQRDVDAAIGQADIVEDDVDLVVADDLADRRFDPGEIVLRLLDPRSRRGAHVQPHLAGIDLREEIHPELREQQARSDDQRRRRTPTVSSGPVDRPGQRVAIDLAEVVEARLESR